MFLHAMFKVEGVVYVATVGSVVPRQSTHVLWKKPTQGWFKGNTYAATCAQAEVDGGDETATVVRRFSNDGLDVLATAHEREKEKK
ncbi:hypothetical protein EZV62_018297 [Acer yangbiense]|uniref:Uncharacterized protein n=1 Tax=Acer yangbiense TaxID=1000413 RepID=A0A5C7HJF4_9ROSI|nr:hypothetical protein EZV62_018297 [Acer yangbiense]